MCTHIRFDYEYSTTFFHNFFQRAMNVGSDGMFGQHPAAMDIGLVTTPRASLSSYPTRIALPVVPTQHNRANQFSSVLHGINNFGPPNSAPTMPGVQ